MCEHARVSVWCVRVCMCVRVCESVHARVRVCVSVRVCMYVCEHACMCVSGGVCARRSVGFILLHHLEVLVEGPEFELKPPLLPTRRGASHEGAAGL